MDSTAISGIICRAIHRAKVLRHSSVEMTAHYAKIDVALLKEVAQPWPEVASC